MNTISAEFWKETFISQVEYQSLPTSYSLTDEIGYDQ